MSNYRDYEPTYHISYTVPRTGYLGSLIINFDGHLFLPSMYDLLMNTCREQVKGFDKYTTSDEVIVILSIFKFDMIYQTQREELLKNEWRK